MAKDKDTNEDVSNSSGVRGSCGVSDSLFSFNRPRKFYLFDKEVTQERYSQVNAEFFRLLGSWYPKPVNAFQLYDAAGREWSKVDASKIEAQDNKTTWADMPMVAIKYLRTLPEFDEAVFTGVTEIDLAPTCNGKIVEIDGKKYKLSEV